MISLDDSLDLFQEDTAKTLGTESATKKIQKLKTVLFQVLYPIMGQPNYSRNKNKALIALILDDSLLYKAFRTFISQVPDQFPNYFPVRTFRRGR